IPGDMVALSSNQPAVQPGGDGTSFLGLSQWASRTNGVIRSEQLDNAAWHKADGDFPCTVTADFGVGPDGQTTADRVRCGATSSSQSSYIWQDSACPVGY